MSACFLEIYNFIGKMPIRRLTRMFSIYVPTMKTLKAGVNPVEKITLDTITTNINLWSAEPVWNKVRKTLNYRSWRRLQEGGEGDWCHQLLTCSRWPCKVWSNVASRAVRRGPGTRVSNDTLFLSRVIAGNACINLMWMWMRGRVHQLTKRWRSLNAAPHSSAKVVVGIL